MPKKRKIAVAIPEEETEEIAFPQKTQHPLFVIVQNAQINEAFHPKYIKELQQLYTKIGHKEFMVYMFKCFEQLIVKNETNEYANIGLQFIAKYLSSYQGDENVHPTMTAVFDFILTRISPLPVVRFRLCEFVNLILNSLGQDASLDDNICDNILKYMFNRLKDLSQMVRVQAVYAMQRLQVPDNKNDPIVKIYQYHLNNDSSTLVRKAVITSIGRNVYTIPSIIERLWDVDERVRRHVYLQMCSYPVKSYKVSQRLTFLEQGLNDVESVKKIVVTVLLRQWLGSYNKMFISFIGGLKLDANDTEINRFRKTAKLALLEMFKGEEDSDLIEQLQLVSDDDEEYKGCIPFDKLTVESSLYWSTLLEYFQESDDKSDEVDLIIPELSTFCSYIKRYCEKSIQQDTEKWELLNIQDIIRSLAEILTRFDLGDEIGRQELKLLIADLVTNKDIEENTVKNLVLCLENLFPLTNDRLQFVVELIQDAVNTNSITAIDLTDSSVISLLDSNQDLKVQVSSLKIKIMDLQESETEFIKLKDYNSATKVSEELAHYNEQLSQLIKQAFNNSSIQYKSSNFSRLKTKKVTTKMQIRLLQMIFFTIQSRFVRSLTPNMLQLYKDFICRQTEATDFTVRNWALKCATSSSLLYEQLAKDTYKVLNIQFFRNQNVLVWRTAISAIFELIDKYGFAYFDENDANTTNDKSTQLTTKDKPHTSRQLYNTMENLNIDEDDGLQQKKDNLGTMYLFSHFLEECDDLIMSCALIDGFCRLILHGHYVSDVMISKLLLKFYNPIVSQEVNQLLGIFFESLVFKKKQECLQQSLFPTLIAILDAPYDSPLREIKPEQVIKFVISTTKPCYSSPGLNIHNTFAMQFLKMMTENPTNKEWIRLLSAELPTLEIGDDPLLRNDLKAGFIDLLEIPMETKSISHIKVFIDILDGKKPTSTFSSSNVQQLNDSRDKDLDEFENQTDDEEVISINDARPNEQQNNVTEDVEMNSNTNEIVADKSIPLNTETDKEDQQNEIVVNKSTDLNIATEIEIQQNDPIPSTKNVNKTKAATVVAKKNKNEKSPVTKKSTTKDNVSLTPTTYGLQNSTNARYLRKSMNVRQNLPDDNEMSPSKIRRGRPTRQAVKNSQNQGNRKSKDIARMSTSSVIDTPGGSIIINNSSDEENADTDSSPKLKPQKKSQRQANKKSKDLARVSSSSVSETPGGSIMLDSSDGENAVTSSAPKLKPQKKSQRQANKKSKDLARVSSSSVSETPGGSIMLDSSDDENDVSDKSPKSKSNNTKKTAQKSITDAEIEDMLSQNDSDDDIIPSLQTDERVSKAQKSLFQKPGDSLDDILQASPNKSYNIERQRRAGRSQFQNANNNSNGKGRNKKPVKKQPPKRNAPEHESIDTSSSSIFGNSPPPKIIQVAAIVHRAKSKTTTSDTITPMHTTRSKRLISGQQTESNSKTQSSHKPQTSNKISSSAATNDNKTTKAKATNKNVNSSASKLSPPPALGKNLAKPPMSDNAHQYKTRRAAIKHYMQNNIITRRKSSVGPVQVGATRSNSLTEINDNKESPNSPSKRNTTPKNTLTKKATTAATKSVGEKTPDVRKSRRNIDSADKNQGRSLRNRQQSAKK